MIHLFGFYPIYSLSVQFLSMSTSPGLAENQGKSHLNNRDHACVFAWIVFKKQTVAHYACFAVCLCPLSLSSIWHKPWIVNEVVHFEATTLTPLSERAQRASIWFKGVISSIIPAFIFPVLEN